MVQWNYQQFEEYIEDIRFCKSCSVPLLTSWKGWPTRDRVPILKHLTNGSCPICGSKEEILSINIGWLNYHGPYNTGLPDYWLLVQGKYNDFQRNIFNSWGLPFLRLDVCPACGYQMIISLHYEAIAEQCTNCSYFHRFPNHKEYFFSHN
jgi:hypothetical protein